VPAGRVNDAIFATIDLMPTLAGLCGFELPEDRRIDGIEQVGLLLGERESGRDHFYYHDAGVRRGRWKYLKAEALFHGYAIDPDRKKAEELYDLEADLGERINLAVQHPEKVAELRALMQSIEAGDRLDPKANDR
jgi:arylsulfatase A-like enzyme